MVVLQRVQRVLHRYLSDERRQYYIVQNRLRHNVRYQKTTVDVLGSQIQVADAASFLSMYRLIFIDQVYWFKASTPSPTILDCGANIGLSVLYFKRLYRAARIIAFEPDPDICDVLRTNVTANALSQVEVVESAVWTQNGEVGFLPDHADAGQIAQMSSRGTITVPCVRLRDYLTHSVDLLKMDIEGAEIDVLLDCADSLRHVRSMVLEYHSHVLQPQRLHEMLAMLKEQGFRYYLVAEQTQFNPNKPITTYQGIDQGLLVYAMPRDSIRYDHVEI